jgi:hypothetical protein
MKTVLWKFYFWIVVFLDGMAFVMPQDVMQRRAWETLDMGFLATAFFGLFGFCWGRPLLGRVFWQVFLACFVGWTCFYMYFLTPLSALAVQADHLKISVRLLATVGLVPHLPLLVALYLYAFRRQDLWRI